MKENYAAALKGVLLHEGGNDDDPRDPGGRTSRGIIQTEYDRYRASKGLAPRDVWTADQSEVVEIYRKKYWDVLRCDDLPSGVDYAVFDYGVNSGVSRSAKILQQIVGADVDGEIGPDTIAATRDKDSIFVVNEICDERMDFLHGLHTWQTFGRGWTNRVNDVRALALEMAAASPPTQTSSGGFWSALVALLSRLFGGKTAPTPIKPPIVAGSPAWLREAIKDIGFHEKGANLGIEDFIDEAHTGGLGDPWCAIFVNAKLEEVGIPGTRSAMARSFETNKNFVRLSGPALGAVSTYWRGSPSSGSGHVNFYAGTTPDGRHIGVGGNQSDAVTAAYMDMTRHTGWWWPRSVPLPPIGAVRISGLSAVAAGKEA